MESDERAPLLLTRTIIQPSTQHTLACVAVIAANFFERLAYFSIAGNLVFFLIKEHLDLPIPLATVTILILTAITSCMGLLSGWLSDSYLDRYLTIVAGYIIYIFGYVCFFYYSMLYIGVILVGIGAGTVRTNLLSFGGDQVGCVHFVIR